MERYKIYLKITRTFPVKKTQGKDITIERQKKLMRNNFGERHSKIRIIDNDFNWPCLFLWHIRHHHLAIHSPPTATMGALVLLLVLSEAAAAADMDSTPVGPLTERAAAAEWPARTTPVAGGAPPLRTTLLRLCHESRRRTPVLSRVRPHSLQSALERPTRVARAQKSRHGGILHLQFHHLKSSLSSARPPDADIWFSGGVFFILSQGSCAFYFYWKSRDEYRN